MQEKQFLSKKEIKEFEDYNFSGLRNALEMSPETVIEEIKRSGLRGRGGAGFPTGYKWELAAAESGPRYIIANGDEGEPGTFKDRYLMENCPWLVLEGILIAGYAVRAESGFIYIRGEYSRAIKVFEEVIKRGKKEGILGERILESNFTFDITLIKGAGAYVCGDETSLINSIEGKRGKSRIKPPYPVNRGLFSRPTVVNNIETLSSAAEIINKGSDTYLSLGTEDSRGTKLVCLSGDINEPGVYEVEFGAWSLKEIIEELGKGVSGGRDLKCVIPGGISTPVLTGDKLEVNYTFEDIEDAGSSLGSGAIISIAEDRDLFDLMLNVSRFYMEETCGTCFPCREGNRQINRILKQTGEGFTRKDKKLIQDIGETIRLAARCGLGQTSLNFIKSILENYENEVVTGMTNF